MEEFLPSEIARAVYGYLLSEGCEAAAKIFLETSPNLTECKQRVEKGKRVTHANTLLMGRNLTEVLNIVCSVHSFVKLLNDKQSRHDSEVNNLSELFEQLRSLVLPESTSNASGRASTSGGEASNFIGAVNTGDPPHASSQEDRAGALSQGEGESRESVPPPSTTTTPTTPQPQRRESLAESYKNLVQECSEGVDFSLSPEKQAPRLGGDLSPGKLLLDRVTSDAGNFVCQELEMYSPAQSRSNVTIVSSVTQLISSTTPMPSVHHNLTTPSHPISSTTPVVHEANSQAHWPTPSQTNVFGNVLPPTSGVHSVAVPYHPQPTVSGHSVAVPYNPTSTGNVGVLPDPPIIILSNNKNLPSTSQSAAGGSSPYLRAQPSAASTPYARSAAFATDETACIIYPPVNLYTSRGRKKKPLQYIERKPKRLLPKPPKNPLQVLHIKVLPQVEEQSETGSDMQDDSHNEDNDHELASQLPNLSCEVENNSEALNPLEIIVDDGNEVQKENPENLEGDEKRLSSTKALPEEEKSSNVTPVEITNIEHNEEEVITPKPPAMKKNISRSTPRRNSHVRALSFNTPHKPISSRRANTSPKMPLVRFSPRSSKLKNIKRSSLFKSPPSCQQNKLANINEVEEGNIEDSKEEDNINSVNKSPILKIPIATRSPAPKLSNAWKEVNDVLVPDKPVWDGTIRSFICGDFIDPDPPPKKETKKKSSSKTNVPKKQQKQKEPNLRRSSRLSKPSGESEKDSKSHSEKKEYNILLPTVTLTDCASTSKQNIKKSLKPSVKNMLKKTSIKNLSAKDNNVSNNKRTPVKSQIDEKVEKGKEPDSVNQEITCKSTNLLLDDLVLSSNSCFPSASEETGNTNNQNAKSVAISSVDIVEEALPTAPTNTTRKTNDSIPEENSSPKFVLPSVPVLETPLKDSQIIGQTFINLNTPLLNTIRETSILEDDLLLTPSLPPTPQIKSPGHVEITPCKPCVVVAEADFSNPIKSPVSNIVAGKNVTNVAAKSIKTNIISGSNDKTNSDIGHNNTEISSTNLLGSVGYKENPKKGDFMGNDISKECIVSSSSDSTDNNMLNANILGMSKNTPKVNSNATNVRKNNKLTFNKNTIYSSDSDDEVNTNQRNNEAKSNISKLANHLLKSEKKSLSKTTKKKNAKHIGVKQSMSKQSKRKPTKNVTPEKEREQLQLDLLKRERMMIFGDGYSSSSNSESDADVFEEKVVKKPIKKGKIKITKTSKKKPLNSKISILSDSSSDDNSDPYSVLGNHLDKSVQIKTSTAVKLTTGDNVVSKPTDVVKLSRTGQESKLNYGKATTPPLKNENSEISLQREKTILSISAEKEVTENNLNEKETTHINISVTSSSDSVKESRDNTSFEDDNQITESINVIEKESYSPLIKSRPPTPLNTFVGSQASKQSNEVQQSSNVQEGSKNEFLMSIVSNSSSKSTPLYLAKFDPLYNTSYEVEDGKMCTISFSNTFQHLLLPLSGTKRADRTSLSLENKNLSKDCAKRRIKLTPIVDSNYEKKLKVNYDVDREGNVTTYKVPQNGNKLINTEKLSKADVKETLKDVQHINEQIKVGTVRSSSPHNIESKDKKCVETDVGSFKERTIQENSHSETKVIIFKDDHSSEQKYPRGKTSRDNQIDRQDYHNRREELYSHKSNRSVRDERSRKSRSPPGRRKERSSYRRSSPYSKEYQRRDDRSYSDRHFSRSRRYSEKRNYSSYHNRSHDSPRSKSRQRPHRSREDNRNSKDSGSEKYYSSGKKMSYVDVDNVEDTAKEERHNNVDPRAATLVTYSDTEKNDSPTKDADSLMDFAVMAKTKSKRPRSCSNEKTPPMSNTPVEVQQSTTTSKRKDSVGEETKGSISQETKRLKLAEVDMKEAKSVLKHKLVDMLNVLHPDTSNEAT